MFLVVDYPLHQKPDVNDGENGSKQRQTRRLDPRFFFLSFSSFLYTNQRFLFHLGSIYGFKLTKTVWKGGEEETGPKQGQTCRFGLGILFYFILFVFFIY